MSSDYELLNEELTETTREAERALVRRLDRRLLAFAMMGNVIKVLDNTNLCEFNRNIINWTSWLNTQAWLFYQQMHISVV